MINDILKFVIDDRGTFSPTSAGKERSYTKYSNGELKRRPRLREQRALDGLKCPIIQSIIGVDEVENSGKNVQSGHSPKSCPSLQELSPTFDSEFPMSRRYKLLQSPLHAPRTPSKFGGKERLMKYHISKIEIPTKELSKYKNWKRKIEMQSLRHFSTRQNLSARNERESKSSRQDEKERERKLERRQISSFGSLTSLIATMSKTTISVQNSVLPKSSIPLSSRGNFQTVNTNQYSPPYYIQNTK